MKQYARFNGSGVLEQTCAKTEADQEKLRQWGFFPYEVDELPICELGEFQTFVKKNRQESDKIVGFFEIISNDPALIKQKVSELTSQLSATDYKWRKISEAQYRGVESPYDIEELIATAEQKREQIRKLEDLLITLQ